jgi:uncharacterized membrane protein YccC
MAEIIDFAEIQAQRRRSSARARERGHLELAVKALRQSLAAAAEQLADAAPAEQPELLRRVERLAALVRYGLRMLGDGAEPGLDPTANEAGR